MDEEFYREQRAELARVVPASDVIITTAAIPGRPAPELVTSDMIAAMEPGSVIVDLSAESGGNCEPTVPNQTVSHEGVSIYGPVDLPTTMARTASQLYSNNLHNFLLNLLEDGELAIDTDDAIVDATLLTDDGSIRDTQIRTDESTNDDV